MKTKKFKVGDVVIGNSKANCYTVTLEGCVGVVKQKFANGTIEIVVRQTPCANRSLRHWVEGQSFVVDANRFDIYSPEIKVGDYVRVFCGEKTIRTCGIDPYKAMERMEETKGEYKVGYVSGTKIGVETSAFHNVYWFNVEDVIKVEKPKYRRPRVEEKPTEAKSKPIAKVKFCGNKTTVSFADSFYSVECRRGDTYDPEKGVLLCIAKYAGYSYGDIEKMVKQAEYDKEDFVVGDKVVVLPTRVKADDRFAGRIGKILTQDKVWGNQYWVEFEIKKPDGSLLYDIRTMQPAHEQKSIHKDYLLKIKD